MLRRSLIALALVLVARSAPAAHAAPSGGGTDFASQATLLFRVAACGSDDALPAGFPAKKIAKHCKKMQKKYASYRKKWVDIAKPFLAGIKPANAPSSVVYPFGGGDLSSALTAFPDAMEITTISLEAAGDIRSIDTIKPKKLVKDLAVIGDDIGRLYRAAHSTTKSLQVASHSKLPGTIVFALAALAVHGFVPQSLRYFVLETDGTPRYLTEQELDDAYADWLAAAEEREAKAKKKKASKHFWVENSSPFANIEITFLPADSPLAKTRVYRHIVMNLDDTHLKADDRVIKHLVAKGKVATMTKAASFLLWYDDFSTIRTYLVDHMAFMLSDASGVPPDAAKSAGFEQIPFGTFTGPYFKKGDKHHYGDAFVKLWKNSTKRKLPFRFGYPDETKKGKHLLLTQPTSCKGAVPC